MACSGICSSTKTHRTILAVDNLPDFTMDSDLEALFGVYGTLTHTHLVRDPFTGEFNGQAFVRYKDNLITQQVQADMDFCMYAGHTLAVKLACAGPASAKSTRCLRVSNLPLGISNSEFEGYFRAHGPVTGSVLCAATGVGYIEFGNEEVASKAYEAMDGSLLADSRRSEFLVLIVDFAEKKTVL